MKSWLLGLCIILFSFATALAGQIPEWSEGEPAVGAASVLKPSPPVPISLPTFVSERVTKETALFYFFSKLSSLPTGDARGKCFGL